MQLEGANAKIKKLEKDLGEAQKESRAAKKKFEEELKARVAEEAAKAKGASGAGDKELKVRLLEWGSADAGAGCGEEDNRFREET
jgi:hypothetical protein